MHGLPAEHTAWKRRAEWIGRNFQSTSKGAKSALDEILTFINGDTSQDILCHWCLVESGCCKDQEESLNRLIRLLVPFFTRGFPVPLLSRFKHYGLASSYVKVGTTLCKILPQTLQRMKGSGASISAELSSMIDTLLADTGMSSSGGSLNEEDFQVLLGGLMEADMQYSLQNSVRKNMMIKAFGQEDFPTHTVIMDCLLQPIETGINTLFSRTKILHQLSNLGTAHPSFADLCQKSRSKFLRIVDGSLGQELMVGYLSILEKGLAESIEFGLDIKDSPKLLKLAYDLVIVGVTDTWRRLVLDFKSAPFSLFGLVGLTPQQFLLQWEALHKKFASCNACVDNAFTGLLLSQFPMSKFDGPAAAADSFCQEVQQLLLDVATFAPLSSDLVEIKHGGVQWAVSRRGRQQVRAPKAAREITLLQACLKQFLWAQSHVADETMPSKATASGILKMSGVRSSNQYSVLWLFFNIFGGRNQFTLGYPGMQYSLPDVVCSVFW